jgi:hypothetical protein
MPAFDWNAFGVSAITVLVPVVTSLVIWGARTVLTKTPRILIPIVAVALASGLDLLLAYVTGGAFNPIVGALLGAASVWLREFITTYTEHGLNS